MTLPHGAEWLVILAMVVLVFGAAKLPELARGAGQALRIFKAETRGLKDDQADSVDDTAPVRSRQAELEPPQREPQTQTQTQDDLRPDGVN